MLDWRELKVCELLREREEPHPPARRPVLQLDLPWPWPWVLLETACPWWFPEEAWFAGKQRRRKVPHAPQEARGALVALRAVVPADFDACAWLEARKVAWPSCPDSWRGAIVAVGDLAGTADAMQEESSPWWRSTWPRAWEFDNLLPVEPLAVPPRNDIGAHQLVPVGPEILPELRERWALARYGCYRPARLSADPSRPF